jgi:hypothetical protein
MFRIHPSGYKTWLLNYSSLGPKRRTHLIFGTYRLLPLLKEARRKPDEFRKLLSDGIREKRIQYSEIPSSASTSSAT